MHVIDNESNIQKNCIKVSRGMCLKFWKDRGFVLILPSILACKVRPHPQEPKAVTFWDKAVLFLGKISPEKLAGKFTFSFRTALKI